MRHLFRLPALIAACVALAPALSACSVNSNFSSNGLGDGALPVSGADLSGQRFSGVDLRGPDNLVVRTGSAPTINADGAADTVALLRYKIEGDTILIGRKDGASSTSDRATITLTVPELTAISLAGSGNARVDRMTGSKADIALAGSGSLAVADMTARTLDASIGGSGDITLAGKSDRASLSIAGSGDIDASAYRADTADISVAGSGDVALASDGKVAASIMGSGDVRVTGRAQCTESKMGSGKLTCGE